jgi:predicted transcriptional regulator of viral defense system
VDTVIGAFQRYSADLDVDRLRAYLQRFGVAAVAKRAEYILSQLHIAPSEPSPLAATRQRHYTLLDPHGPHNGTPVPRFELIDNVAQKAWHGS